MPETASSEQETRPLTFVERVPKDDAQSNAPTAGSWAPRRILTRSRTRRSALAETVSPPGFRRAANQHALHPEQLAEHR